MKQSKTRQAIRIVCGTFLAVWAVVDYVGAAVMLDFTFVPWWIPAAAAFGIAAFSGLVMWRMWKWLTCMNTFVWNYICHIFFFTGLLMIAQLMINHSVSSGEASRHEKAFVAKVYKEKRYHTRRVRRNVYTRGAPYYVYCADLRLDNGSTSTINLNRKRYDTLHKGDSVGIVVTRGFFGWEELRTDSISYPAPHKKKNKRRSFPRRRPSHNEQI